MLIDTALAESRNLTGTQTARAAFDSMTKSVLREQLVDEQLSLCAFCMRRIRVTGKTGAINMVIAHRTPIDADPKLTLTWSNLLGSCDGTRTTGRTCDAAQGNRVLTIDPTKQLCISTLKYERRSESGDGYYLTSTDPERAADIEALGLNRGDLPSLREAALEALRGHFRKQHPKKPSTRPSLGIFLVKLRSECGRTAPEMLGFLEWWFGI